MTTQSPDDLGVPFPEIYHRLRGQFDQLSDTSRIFYWPTVDLETLRAVDGSTAAPPLMASTFRRLYAEIAFGASGVPLPSLEEIDDRANRRLDQDLIPIAIGAFRLHTAETFLSPTTRAALEPVLATGEAIFAGAITGEDTRLFIGAPRPHYGRRARFVIPRDLFVSNLGEEPASILGAFGDGGGPRPIGFDSPIEVVYPNTGSIRIDLTIRFAARELHAATTLTIAEELAIPPHSGWPINKGVAKGYAFQFLGFGNSRLSNPVIISEGFRADGDPARELPSLWATLDERKFASNMLYLGFDIILLCYDKPTLSIFTNADVAVQCIQEVLKRCPSPSPIVGGASMGGLVTRCALAWLAKYGSGDERSAVKHYFSFDTPHLGANLPLSVQMAVNDIANYYLVLKPVIQGSLDLFNSDACRQMVLYWWDDSQRKVQKPDQRRQKFISDLKDMGNWSPHAARFGVSNGRADGRQGDDTVPKGTRAYSFTLRTPVGLSQTLISASGELTQPGPEYDYLHSTSGREYRTRDRFVDIDSAQSGTGDFFKRFADTLPKAPSPAYPNSTFIPTISALAMSTLDPYKEDDLDRNLIESRPPSDLAAYQWSAKNTPHVQVNPEIERFIFSQAGTVGVIYRNNDQELCGIVSVGDQWKYLNLRATARFFSVYRKGPRLLVPYSDSKQELHQITLIRGAQPSDQNITRAVKGDLPRVNDAVTGWDYGGQHLAFSTQNSDIIEVWGDEQTGWNWGSQLLARGYPSGFSPQGLATTGQSIYYTPQAGAPGGGFNIFQIWYDARNRKWQLGDPMNTSTGRAPASAGFNCYAQGEEQHVVYWTYEPSDSPTEQPGFVYDLYWNGSTWVGRNLSQLAGASVKCIGKPQGVSRSGVTGVVYFGTDNRFHQLYPTDGGKWIDVDLFVRSNEPLPKALSYAAACSIGHSQHVFYLAEDQHWHDLFIEELGGSVTHTDVSVKSGAPNAKDVIYPGAFAWAGRI